MDESTKTVHANIETSSFPNLVAAPNQRRIVTSIAEEELKITNPRTPRRHNAGAGVQAGEVTALDCFSHKAVCLLLARLRRLATSANRSLLGEQRRGANRSISTRLTHNGHRLP